MRSFILAIVLMTLSVFLYGQGQQGLYHRIKINLNSTDIQDLRELGLETDHGVLRPGSHLINDFSERDIDLLDSHGIDYEVLITDMTSYYADRARQVLHNHEHGDDYPKRSIDQDCTPSSIDLSRYTTPSNYKFGSLAGYLTYDQALEELAKMSALYPELITPLMPIADYMTEEGRPIQYMRLSDNPQVEDPTEPQVLYTSLHHSREPNSLAQNIYYMWYLLENYDTDEEVRYLVDNTELYFIPIVNPDGYAWVSESEPQGGSLWRKNRATINGSKVGVDLNRNYGYEWGFDNAGSSPNPNSATFRGLAPFSEPETQAVRHLCEEHRFRLALNYHCFGNLLIYPWGYNDGPTPDDATFKGMARLLTTENDYLAGTGTETVGYVVNGDSDDYMYGEQTTKLKIYSYTPEVGSGIDGFWPAPDRIDFLNKSCMYQNLALAHLTKNYHTAVLDYDDKPTKGQPISADLSVTRYGFDSDPITVRVYTIAGEEVGPIDMEITQDQLSTWERTLTWTSTDFDLSRFVVELDHGAYVSRDTFSITPLGPADGQISTLIDTDFTMEEGFVSGTWGLTSETFTSAPSSMTDSPGGPYAPNRFSQLLYATPIDLSDAVQAELSFDLIYEIEEDYDFAQVRVSTDNGESWTALCGDFTEAGVSDQVLNEPLYDGELPWSRETIDLSDYAGESNLLLDFVLISDGGVEDDGIYIDDLVLTMISTSTVSTTSIEPKDMVLRVYPNPASQQLHVDYTDGRYLLIASDGQRRPAIVKDGELDIVDLAVGMYTLIHVEDAVTTRFVVLR